MWEELGVAGYEVNSSLSGGAPCIGMDLGSIWVLELKAWVFVACRGACYASCSLWVNWWKAPYAIESWRGGSWLPLSDPEQSGYVLPVSSERLRRSILRLTAQRIA